MIQRKQIKSYGLKPIKITETFVAGTVTYSISNANFGGTAPALITTASTGSTGVLVSGVSPVVYPIKAVDTNKAVQTESGNLVYAKLINSSGLVFTLVETNGSGDFVDVSASDVILANLNSKQISFTLNEITRWENITIEDELAKNKEIDELLINAKTLKPMSQLINPSNINSVAGIDSFEVNNIIDSNIPFTVTINGISYSSLSEIVSYDTSSTPKSVKIDTTKLGFSISSTDEVIVSYFYK
jgi:hypothetical protein